MSEGLEFRLRPGEGLPSCRAAGNFAASAACFGELCSSTPGGDEATGGPKSWALDRAARTNEITPWLAKVQQEALALARVSSGSSQIPIEVSSDLFFREIRSVSASVIDDGTETGQGCGRPRAGTFGVFDSGRQGELSAQPASLDLSPGRHFPVCAGSIRTIRHNFGRSCLQSSCSLNARL